jgi:hypothetical protein
LEPFCILRQNRVTISLSVQETITMSLLTLIIAIVVVGVVLWAVNSFIPMSPGIKKLLNIVVIAVLVIWLLQQFGLFDALGTVHIGGAGHRR